MNGTNTVLLFRKGQIHYTKTVTNMTVAKLISFSSNDVVYRLPASMRKYSTIGDNADINVLEHKRSLVSACS